MFDGLRFRGHLAVAALLFLDGMVFTLRLTVLAAVGGIVLGTLIAIMRLSRFRVLSSVAATYVNVVRSLPLVLVIFWFYFLIPWVWQWADRGCPSDAGRRVLFGADHLHPVRGGLLRRDHARRHPVRSQGAGGCRSRARHEQWQVMGYIVLPQAFRNMLPVLLTQTIILFQDTSLVYVLSITDFLGAASKVANRDFRLVEMYLFAAVVYFAISFTLSSLVRRLQAQIAIVR